MRTTVMEVFQVFLSDFWDKVEKKSGNALSFITHCPVNDTVIPLSTRAPIFQRPLSHKFYQLQSLLQY